VIVVADTSPLNYLIRLGHPDILRQIYGRVLVPPAVSIEMRHPDAPPEVQDWAAAPPLWLERITVTELDTSLAEELGMGERQAISLAIELRADVLLIDELAGRQEAKARHINVAGTLAVLLQASLRGYLAFPDELDRLHRLKFRASAALEADMLARYYKLIKH
jgi:predicted nucleic acid-binding protein